MNYMQTDINASETIKNPAKIYQEEPDIML